MSGDDAVSEQSNPKHDTRSGDDHAAQEAAAPSGAASNRVFVGNLSWRTSWQNLKDHMREVGEVRFADIFYERGSQHGRRRPRSKGCGVVEYESVADAQKAIEKLNESDLDGRKIFIQADAKPDIRISRPRPRFQGRGRGRGGRGRGRRGRGGFRGNSDRKVYVGNLAYNTSWQTLKDHMRTAGNVTFVDIFEDFNGRSKGCAVVEFGAEEDASSAIKKLNDTELDGRQIFIREDRPKEKRHSPDDDDTGGQDDEVASDQSKHRDSSNSASDASDAASSPPSIQNTDCAGDDADRGGIGIFLGNLSFAATSEDLKKHFQDYDILDVTVPKTKDGQSKGFAIMTVNSETLRRRIIEDFNDSEKGKLMGRYMAVREDKKTADGGARRGR